MTGECIADVTLRELMIAFNMRRKLDVTFRNWKDGMVWTCEAKIDIEAFSGRGGQVANQVFRHISLHIKGCFHNKMLTVIYYSNYYLL